MSESDNLGKSKDSVTRFNVTEEQSIKFQCKGHLQIPPGAYILVEKNAPDSRIAHTLGLEEASVSFPTRDKPILYSILDRSPKPLITEQNTQIGLKEQRFLKKLVSQSIRNNP